MKCPSGRRYQREADSVHADLGCHHQGTTAAADKSDLWLSHGMSILDRVKKPHLASTILVVLVNSHFVELFLANGTVMGLSLHLLGDQNRLVLGFVAIGHFGVFCNSLTELVIIHLGINDRQILPVFSAINSVDLSVWHLGSVILLSFYALTSTGGRINLCYICQSISDSLSVSSLHLTKHASNTHHSGTSCLWLHLEMCCTFCRPKHQFQAENIDRVVFWLILKKKKIVI